MLSQCPISCASEIFQALSLVLFQQSLYFPLYLLVSARLLQHITYPACYVSTSYHPLEEVRGCDVRHVHHVKGHGAKAYSRHIQPSRYTSFPWISVCLKLFCNLCPSVQSKDLLSFSKKCKSAFMNVKKDVVNMLCTLKLSWSYLKYRVSHVE